MGTLLAGAFHVFAGAGVDAEGVAFFYEHWGVNYEAGFQGNGFGNVAAAVAFGIGGAFRNFEFYFYWQLNGHGLIVKAQNSDFRSLF
jgi:hypothetical protein